MLTELVADLKRDEGTGPVVNNRLFPYFDCCGKFFRLCTCTPQGKLTIAHGRNIEDIGVSEEEATVLLENDAELAVEDLAQSFSWWTGLNPVRQRALANFRFNVGPGTFKTFTTTLRHIARGDFKKAAAAFRENKKYFSQVKGRAERIAKMIESGQ